MTANHVLMYCYCNVVVLLQAKCLKTFTCESWHKSTGSPENKPAFSSVMDSEVSMFVNTCCVIIRNWGKHFSNYKN